MDDGPGYYDRDGIPITLEQFVSMRPDQSAIVVGSTSIMDGAALVRGYDVSTVWLGFDHRYGGEGPPLIFETLVFTDDPEWSGMCARYATEAEAREGHAKMVSMVAAQVVNPLVVDTDAQP